MNQQTFFEKFDVLADAPDGVQKLREMILLLAVQGKLMPQAREDEPAAVLLEKIKVIKERLAKEGKFRKSNFLPPIREDEKYFKLPTGWQWVRFDDICSYIQRGKGPKYVEKSDIPVVSQKCIQWDGFKLDRAKFISPSTLEKYNEERFLITGDLLWNSTGTGTIGRVNVYVHEDNSYDKIVADSHVTVIRPILMNSRFFYCWVASPIIQNEIEEMASGTTNQIELNLSTIKNHLVPLPPFDEQKRIVAKVDQLMALCDQLEDRQQKKHEQRIRLNNAALNKLFTAPAPEEFAQHWQRICDNFDLLYDAPETVGQLRQGILQLAVQGKLVAQDEGGEPATVLLEKIKVSKEGQKQSWNRKSQLLSPIEPEEISFSPPKNWEWKRLGEITEIVGGVTKGRKLLGRQTAYYPYLRVANVQRGFLNLDVIKEIEIPKEELEKYRLHRGDVLLTEGGDWDKLGRSAIWDGQIQDCIHQNHIFRARPWNIGLRSQWIVLFTNSSVGRQYFENASKKTTNLASINMTQLRNCPFPIPPVDEQDRILKKVNELNALCDELEAGLVQAQTDGGKLMEAVVHHVLAG